jgi:hypothetical protein
MGIFKMLTSAFEKSFCRYLLGYVKLSLPLEENRENKKSQTLSAGNDAELNLPLCVLYLNIGNNCCSKNSRLSPGFLYLVLREDE